MSSVYFDKVSNKTLLIPAGDIHGYNVRYAIIAHSHKENTNPLLTKANSKQKEQLNRTLEVLKLRGKV